MINTSAAPVLKMSWALMAVKKEPEQVMFQVAVFMNSWTLLKWPDPESINDSACSTSLPLVSLFLASPAAWVINSPAELQSSRANSHSFWAPWHLGDTIYWLFSSIAVWVASVKYCPYVASVSESKLDVVFPTASISLLNSPECFWTFAIHWASW